MCEIEFKDFETFRLQIQDSTLRLFYLRIFLTPMAWPNKMVSLGIRTHIRTVELHQTETLERRSTNSATVPRHQYLDFK